MNSAIKSRGAAIVDFVPSIEASSDPDRPRPPADFLYPPLQDGKENLLVRILRPFATAGPRCRFPGGSATQMHEIECPLATVLPERLREARNDLTRRWLDRIVARATLPSPST